MDAKDFLKRVKDDDVKFVSLQFTDVVGSVKSVDMPVNRLEGALEDGVWFDGSSVEGFAPIYESDLIAMPDVRTFQLLPWKVNGENVGRLICDIHNPDGTPYAGAPRHVLRRALKRIEKQSMTYYLGPELEYFRAGIRRRTPEFLARAQVARGEELPRKRGRPGILPEAGCRSWSPAARTAPRRGRNRIKGPSLSGLSP